MIKKNIHQESIIQEKGCHGGKGAVLFRRILQEEFESAISFLDYTIIPAGATIGFHPHQDSEEVYIVLKGEGLMRVDNEEQRVVEGTGEPSTVLSLESGLAALGLQAGAVLLVHASLSALGWVCGGPVAAILALERVLGPQGTLVMPTHTDGYSDPYTQLYNAWPSELQEEIQNTMPLYDPLRTPSVSMGRVAELFRTWSDVLRSNHPRYSFAAWGKEARFVTEGHELSFSLGETSPLARVYDLGGYVLLIGVDHGNNTSIHLAEYRAPNPRMKECGVPWLVNGEREWVTFPDVDLLS